MQSRQNGDFKRSVLSALAAIVAAAVPSLVPSTALAENNKTPSANSAPAAEKDAKATPAKRTKKAQAARAKPALTKADKKNDKPEAKPEEPQVKGDAKAHAGASKAKKTKKTASRSAGAKKKTAKKADSEAPRRPCKGTSIAMDRGGLEGQNLVLVDCHDKPLAKADEALSVLARPWGAPRPASVAAAHAPSAAAPGGKGKLAHDPRGAAKDEIAPGVKLLDKGLLTRVTAIARRFPGRTISLVSGYRPQSRGSLHQGGRALDLRVAGVSNQELVAFCKTLPDTGCGYYPNSSFVHVDVRNPGTGKVTWIDTSGPGESANYVSQWPLPAEQSDTAVLPPDREPHDKDVDPWAVDTGDEHATHPGHEAAGGADADDGDEKRARFHPGSP